jgi:hypothetical protein
MPLNSISGNFVAPYISAYRIATEENPAIKDKLANFKKQFDAFNDAPINEIERIQILKVCSEYEKLIGLER